MMDFFFAKNFIIDARQVPISTSTAVPLTSVQVPKCDEILLLTLIYLNLDFRYKIFKFQYQNRIYHLEIG